MFGFTYTVVSVLVVTRGGRLYSAEEVGHLSQTVLDGYRYAWVHNFSMCCRQGYVQGQELSHHI